MPDYARCMHCQAPLVLEGRSYDCTDCNTRWVPHDLGVTERVEEIRSRQIQERQAARERREAWNDLSRIERARVHLGLREFDPDVEVEDA